MYKRVLIKLSGESLLGKREYGIEPKACLHVAEELKSVHDAGISVVVVIGAGNIFRGLSASQNGIERATADYIGMMATVMNGLALQNALEKLGLETRLLSSLNVSQVAEAYIRRRALRHLEKNRVVILSGGTGNPYFTTDTGAALRTMELECDALFKATKVDGVYDMDPVKHSDATRFDSLSHQQVIEQNLGVMDMAAMALARDNNITIEVYNFFQPGNTLRVASGQHIGTRVQTTD